MENDLEGIYNFFIEKGLSNPWQIHDHVHIHLTAAILDEITRKWDLVENVSHKAGFLLSLLSSPRQRLKMELKLHAERLLTRSLNDSNQYIVFLSQCLQTWISDGHISFDDTKEGSQDNLLHSTLDLINSKLDSKEISFYPRELSYMNDNARSCIDGVVNTTGNISLEFKADHTLPSKEARYKKYGLSGPLNLDARSITPPGSGPSTPTATSLPTMKPLLRKKSSQVFMKSRPAPLGVPRRTSLGPNSSGPKSSGPKGLQKQSKIKMLDIDEAQDINKSKADLQKKLEEDARLEKERKAAEAQAKKEAKEEERLAKIREKEAREREKREQAEKKRRTMSPESEATSAKRQKKMDPATLQSQASSASLDSTTSSQDLRPPHKPQSIDNIVLQYDEPAQEPPQPVIPDTISANTREIIANCNAVDPVEVLLIDDFLNGRYDRHEEVREVKLSERIVQDDKGTRKREVLWFSMDYDKCQWRKVKRSTRVHT